MAIATAGTPASVSTAGPTSSLSWSQTCDAGADFLGVGTAARGATAANRPVTGITYNSVALTKIRADDDGTEEHSTELWRLLSPTTGSALTVAVTFTGSLSVGAMGFSQPFSGVHQTT